MPRPMPTASNARQVGRPAQGRRTDTPFNRPKASYKADAAPVVKSRGTVSNPKDTGRWSLKRLVTDETPTVVQL